MNDDEGGACHFSWDANGTSHTCFENGKHAWHVCDGGGECPERLQVVNVDKPERQTVKRRKHYGARR